MTRTRTLRTQRPLIGALVLTVALIATLLTLFSAAPAMAATPDTASAVAAAVPDGGEYVPDQDDANQTIYNSQYRTINRWGDATTSFFTKYDGFIGSQLIDQAQRGINQSMQMTIGNFFMSTTSNAAQWAVSFDAVDQIGKTIDDITKQVANALFSDGAGVGTTSVIIVVIIVLLVSIIFRSVRQGGAALMIRRVGGAALILGLLFAMSTATLNGTGTTDAEGSYHPVPLSPGWVVKTVNDGVSNLAAVPATLFIDGVQPLVTGATADQGALPSASGYDPRANLSCARFTGSMQDRLDAQQAAADRAGSGGLVAITSVMDQLWSDTGLQTWKQIQTGFNNPYGTKMFCRILEVRSVVSTSSSSASITTGGQDDASAWRGAVSGEFGDNAPFSPDSPANTAASYVAWAACTPMDVNGNSITWEWERGWEGFKGGTSPNGAQTMEASNADSLCDKWWTAITKEGAAQDIPDEFDISGEAGWIDDRTNGIENDRQRDQVRDFLYALTGVNSTGGATATWAYASSAVLQFVAFGFLAVLTFLAKLFAAMFTITLWFILIGALFSANPFKDRILKAFNRFLGVTIFAAMMTLIMTFVVLFARMLIGLGNTWFGAGTIFAMLWAGFAPLAALILVHLLFTKVFRMPSPVTLSGAQAWNRAGATGALGAAAAAGVGGYAGSRFGGMARSAANRAGRSAANTALSKATGGRLGGTPTRRSGMGAGQRMRERDVETEAVVETLTPRQVKQQARAAQQNELSAARAWHREQNGVAAPGDFKGSLTDLRGRAAARTRELAGNAQNKVAATPLARELHSRGEYRRELRAARVNGDVEALAAARDEQRSKLSTTTARIAAVMDAPAAAANRARLGVESASASTQATAQNVWNAPKVVGARADAAILAGNTRAAARFVAQSDVGRASAVVSRYAVKPVKAAARGTAAVAKRSSNNAALIDQFRAARSAKQSAAASTSSAGSPAASSTSPAG